MSFQETFEKVAIILKNVGSNVVEENYDGLIVKKLEASNTLDKGRTTKQSHIAITGPQMDMFPYVRADGYFETDYDTEDQDLKKFFVAQIPVYLHKENVDYLDPNAKLFIENEKLVHVSIVRSRRKDAADQIQMSMTYMDTPEYIEYRRIVHAGSYMILMKRKEKVEYDLFSVKSNDAKTSEVSLEEYNNCFEKKTTNTLVHVEEISVKDDSLNEFKDVLEHNLWGIHIKDKNDALSETNPHVCIGWSEMGDMSALENTEDIMSVYEEHYTKNNRAKGQDVGMIRRFLKELQIGDYIIFAETSVFHIGRIASDYYYDNSDNPNQSTDYTNNRKVKWLKTNISRKILSKAMHNSLATAMSIFGINDYRAAVVDILNDTYKKDDDNPICVEDIVLKYNTDVAIPFERNRIVFGAPGTGKSFRLKQDCENLQNEHNGVFERVTFHPDYTYSQFVGTYKPVMDEDGEKIKYEYVPGPFMRVLVEALRSAMSNAPKPYILLIEEINRAKVAAVFGDVFQLLDRDDQGVSEYEIQTSVDIRKYLSREDVLGGNADNYSKLRMPNNMFIWATMNSADQGVFPMDTAFKRRWDFEYIGINEEEADIQGKCFIDIPGCEEKIEWNKLRKAINDKMSSADFKINEDKLMGPYFISKNVIDRGDTAEFMKIFTSKVIMYLYEDAVKQKKNSFFEGCPDTSKYSSICSFFKSNGLEIFGKTFKADYYDRYKG